MKHYILTFKVNATLIRITYFMNSTQRFKQQSFIVSLANECDIKEQKQTKMWFISSASQF
jgi:hypothetical protein